ALRESKQLSQEQLALKASVDQSGLSKLERFGISPVPFKTLIRIAEPLDYIVEAQVRPKTGERDLNVATEVAARVSHVLDCQVRRVGHISPQLCLKMR